MADSAGSADQELTFAADTANGFLGIIDRLTEKLGSATSLGLGPGLFARLKNVGGNGNVSLHFCCGDADRIVTT